MGSAKYAVIAIPAVTDKDVARLFVQPTLPAALVEDLCEELNAVNNHREATLTVFHVQRKDDALQQVRQTLFDILNGKPDVLYSVHVVDPLCPEIGAVRVHMTPDGEEDLPEEERQALLLQRACDALGNDTLLLKGVRTFYSYREQIA